MRVLLLLRGAPGCGKSTWIEKHGLGEYTLSSDHIRLLCASPVLGTDGNYTIEQTNDKIVWKTLFEILERRMLQGEFTVIDATNSKTSEMNRYKQLCEMYRYRIYCVDFTDIPIETVKERNRKRPILKYVPEEAIEKAYSRFETQKIPAGITPIKPDELDKIWMKKIDLSSYSRIHHIGDIHGCATALKEYFEENGGIKDDEFYIFTGDYIDRGLENVDVVNFLSSICEKKNVCLLEGNHERPLWLWANGEPTGSKEFELITRTQLENAKIDKKSVRILSRRFCQCAYYSYDGNTYLVTHAGISTIPYNLTTLSSRQMIRGVGSYDDVEKVAQSFNANTPPNTFQIHGHRNPMGLPVKVGDTRTFNLEGGVEFGGDLRCVQIAHGGEVVISEIQNKIYRERGYKPVKEEDKTVADLILEMRNNRYIKEHRFGDISSFNFTKEAFYKGKWNEQTMKARGFFINIPKSKIVARSYNKFFNINETEDTKLEVLRNTFKFPLTAYVKENGFLGIVSYNDEDEKLFITTKSAPDSPYADLLRKIFEEKVPEESREKLRLFSKENNVSFIFECIDPLNDPHIIEYPNEKLVLLDIVHNDLSYKKFNYYELTKVAKEIGLTIKEKAFEINSWEEFYEWYTAVTAEEYKYNGEYIEGFVVEDAAGYMVKIKLAYYKFWKHMRSVADETLKKGYTSRTASLLTPLANRFYGWIKNTLVTEGSAVLPDNICALRKQFLQTEKSEGFENEQI